MLSGTRWTVLTQIDAILETLASSLQLLQKDTVLRDHAVTDDDARIMATTPARGLL